MNQRVSILLIVLVGTVVRFLYGLKFQLWNLAPDQIAWELVLQEIVDEKVISYDHFIHYPHEGGTILVSIISLLFKPFTSVYSLVCSAFLIDMLSRFIQIEITSRIFGKKVGWYYGAWTIFSLPLIISWTGMPFGLHSISSLFPFLFLGIISRTHNNRQSYLIDGVLLGLLGWFIYSNFLMLPVYVGYLFLTGKRKEVGYVLFSFIIILCLHISTRIVFDPGFKLSTFSASSIRGEEFDLLNVNVYKRIYLVWIDLIKQISLIPDSSLISSNFIRTSWFSLSIGGILFSIYLAIKGRVSNQVFVAFVIMVVYTSVYAVSPFYMKYGEWANYMNIRHLTYILPLFVCISLIGFSTLNRSQFVSMILLIVSIYGFAISYQQKPVHMELIRPAGWVLATKFGHLPVQVTSLIERDTVNTSELMIGVGWGTSTALFNGYELNDSTHEDVKERISMLKQLKMQYTNDFRNLFEQGVDYSFSESVTPRLDTNLLHIYLQDSRKLP